MGSEHRLIRIEGKLDKLEFALTKIARSEEKIASLIERQTRLEEEYRTMRKEQKLIDRKVGTHSTKLELHENVISGLRKIFWASITAIIISGIGGIMFAYNLLQQTAGIIS